MGDDVIVPITVLLELAWVLRRTYRFDRATLAAALRGVLNLSSVTIAGEDRVRWAIDRYADDGDIADLIHIATARGATAFVSFDEALAKEVGLATPLVVRRPA